MLLSLAPELIQAISHELESIKDIKSFRLTCKQMDRALASEVLRGITVDVNSKTFARELCKLQYFAEGPPACRWVRWICIRSLSPALYLHIHNPWTPDREAAAETQELKKYLFNALSSLTNVRSVGWTLGLKDGEWAHNAIIGALRTLPNLQRLYVGLTWPTSRFEIPFHFLTALRDIDIDCINQEVHHQKTFENLVRMISQSPLLEAISFSSGPVYSGRTSRSLHDLFECYLESILPLRLKHLTLKDCYICLDDENIMRHLRHLTRLSLQNLLEGDSNDSDSISKDVSEKQHRRGSSHEQIWRAIYSADLRLEEITLDTISWAFVEYIGSYSGLKKLKIVTKGYNSQVESDSAAEEFYEALEKHVGSIKELDIDACYEGLWCFGHHNQALFSTLQHLRTLSVKVRSNDIISRSSEDIIRVLIDTAVTYMPQLEWLFASVVSLEAYRSRCESSANYHAHSRKKIADRVREYRAPLGCKRLPTFKIGSWLPTGAFVGCSPRKGERLRYFRVPFDIDMNENQDEEMFYTYNLY